MQHKMVICSKFVMAFTSVCSVPQGSVLWTILVHTTYISWQYHNFFMPIYASSSGRHDVEQIKVNILSSVSLIPLICRLHWARMFSPPNRSTLLCSNVIKFVRWETGEIVHYLPDQKKQEQNFGSLSNCRYCTYRAQNLPGPAPNNVLTEPKISSKSVQFRRSYSWMREHHFLPRGVFPWQALQDYKYIIIYLIVPSSLATLNSSNVM